MGSCNPKITKNEWQKTIFQITLSPFLWFFSSNATTEGTRAQQENGNVVRKLFSLVIVVLISVQLFCEIFVTIQYKFKWE